VATIFHKLGSLFLLFISISNRFVPTTNSTILLFLRIFIFSIFWRSGLTKIADWNTTLLLFENEYSVPVIAPKIAAILATCFELVMPVLIFIGLGTRLAVIPLICITFVIQYTYLNNHQHFEWLLCLLILFFVGAGRFSWDVFIYKKVSGDSEMGVNSILLSLIISICMTIFVLHEVIAALGDSKPWLDGVLNSWNNIWAEKVKGK
jgi:putative oxidoreductase